MVAATAPARGRARSIAGLEALARLLATDQAATRQRERLAAALGVPHGGAASWDHGFVARYTVAAVP